MGRGGRKKSPIRRHFPEKVIKGKLQIACEFCHLEMALGTSSARLVQHILRSCTGPVTAEARSTAEREGAKAASGGTSSDDDDGCDAPEAKRVRSGPSDGFIPVTTRSQKEDFDDLMGQFFIENDIAFRAADSASWRRFIHAVRATYESACSKTLRTTTLEKIAAHAKKHLIETVEQSTVVSISADGWSNVRGERFLHIMVCCPKPLLWDSVDISESAVPGEHDPSCSGEFIADKLLAAIRDIEEKTGKRVVAIVTDNAANMKKAWELVKRERPMILTYGCVAHIINLFIGDLVKHCGVFCWAVNLATRLADRVKNAPNVLAAIRIIQRREYGTEFSFFVPGNTRWFSIYATIACVLRSRRALCTYGIDCKDDEYKKIVNDDRFWDACRTIEPILRQCCLSILMVEGDGVSIECAFPAMIAIGASLEQWNHPEKDRALELYRERAAFLYSPALVAASAMNPISPVCPSARRITREFIRARYPESKATVLIEEFDRFQTRTGEYASEALWAPDETGDAWEWWLKRKGNLRNFALGMLAPPCSSAGTERSFKSRASVHTPKRNRLANSRAVACVRAKSYLKSLSPKKRRNRKHTLISAVEPQRPASSAPNDAEADVEAPTITDEEDVEEWDAQVAEVDGDYTQLDYVSLDGEEFFTGLPEVAPLARDVPMFAEFQQPGAPAVAANHDEDPELTMTDLWGPAGPHPLNVGEYAVT